MAIEFAKATQVTRKEIDMTQFKGAVLLIGSLWWDDRFNRPKWREGHLRKRDKAVVKAPIRYGRYSKGNLYTMVLSKEFDYDSERGDAFLVPLRQKIATIKDLEREAVALSKAEGISKEADEKFAEEWGMVSIILSDTCALRDESLKLWKKRLPKKEGYWRRFRQGSEVSAVGPDGFLRVEPFKFADGGGSVFDQFDFVLAAVNAPKLKGQEAGKRDKARYPTPKEIAALAFSEPRQYFKNNRKHGLCTSKDDEILNAKPKTV